MNWFDVVRKTMTTALTLMTVLSLSNTSLAGTRDSGGGDPDALEFARKAKDVVAWAASHKNLVSVDPSAIASSLSSLIASLQDGEKARLTFTDNSLKDKDGVSKAAIFDRKEISIIVNRAMWRQLKEDSRTELVATELFGLSGSNARYSEAMLLRDSMTLGYLRCIVKWDQGSGNVFQRYLEKPVHNHLEKENFNFDFQNIKMSALVSKSGIKDPSDIQARLESVKILDAQSDRLVDKYSAKDATKKIHKIGDLEVTGLGNKISDFSWACAIGSKEDLPRKL